MRRSFEFEPEVSSEQKRNKPRIHYAKNENKKQIKGKQIKKYKTKKPLRMDEY